MGKTDRKEKKGKQDHPKEEKEKQMDEEQIDPDDIQPDDLEEEEDRPGYSPFVYSNIFFEWFYRVFSDNLAPT